MAGADLRETGSREFTEAVRKAGDIVRLVSDYVSLKPSGSRFKGLCPFHQEKTPSFHVDPQLQFFYCFGCSTGGDAFKFVMLYEKLTFPQAVEFLARKWGVPLPQSSYSHDAGPAARAHELNAAAETFFRTTLRESSGAARARDYLTLRGLDPATIDGLALGYAPDAWDELRSHLLSRRFSVEEMLAAGLVIPRKDGSGHYDRFRDRIMFPIRDVTGRTVAFGGRAIGDAQPKYMNTPETQAYIKGDHLYGLDLARQAIRREGYAIVVEGYLDAAALIQWGFDNVVATLGTAFTAAQVRLLHRHSEKAIVSYDGDAAGSAATVRSLDLLLEEGLEVRVADLPAGLDPDDLLRRSGPDAYRDLLTGAPAYLEFLIRREARSRDISRVEEKVAAVNALLPHIARLHSSVARGSWAGQLAATLGIEDELVLQELRTALKAGRPAVRQRPGSSELPIREAEARLVSLLLRSDEARARARETLEPADLEGTSVGAILRCLLRLPEAGMHLDHATVLADLESESDRELLTRIAFREEAESGLEDVDRCIEALRHGRFKKEGREVQNAILGTPSTEVDDLLMTKFRFAKKMDAPFRCEER
jgi:DNA primase